MKPWMDYIYIQEYICVCVYSNHERAQNTHIMRFLQRHGISYHYLPTTDQNKIEEEIFELVKDTDFIVLARYMQVISNLFSPSLCLVYASLQGTALYWLEHFSLDRYCLVTFESLWKRCNQHTSWLLPSFKGRSPAKQVSEFFDSSTLPWVVLIHILDSGW